MTRDEYKKFVLDEYIIRGFDEEAPTFEFSKVSGNSFMEVVEDLTMKRIYTSIDHVINHYAYPPSFNIVVIPCMDFPGDICYHLTINQLKAEVILDLFIDDDISINNFLNLRNILRNGSETAELFLELITFNRLKEEELDEAITMWKLKS